MGFLYISMDKYMGFNRYFVKFKKTFFNRKVFLSFYFTCMVQL